MSFIFKYFIFTSAAAPLYGGHLSKLDKLNTCWVFMTTEGYHRFSVGEGEVRGIQLQHATSPLDATKFYTLDL